MNLKLLQLGKGVAKYYRQNVKGNKDADCSMIQRKLTRNVLVGKRIKPKEEGKTLYIYGNLEILVVGNTIVWLKNNSGKTRYRVNEDRKKCVGEMLGL